MKVAVISVLAIAGSAFGAWAPTVTQISDGQIQAPTYSSAPAGYTSEAPMTSSVMTSSAAAVSSSMAPYPVPGGNTTWAATGTGAVTSKPVSVSSMATYPSTSEAAGTTPASSAPVPTGAAAALQIGGVAALAGIVALFA